MTVVARPAGERRRYWLSLAALAVVLPAAIAANGWDSFEEWRRSQMRTPILVEKDGAQRYAGAQWRLTGLTRLKDGRPGITLIVAEFEATVDDPAVLRGGPCAVALVDEKERRWLPTFVTSRAVRQGRPSAVDKPRCLSLINASEKGKTVAMAETFSVPEDAIGLELSVTLAGARPAYLRFR